ncbi:hypothetical protein DFH09DRAFT_1146891 [Mycena vulgaris]|nr:hypothetical protein DFH09DRAFT_1146891 [Mycena vulgaris]
MIIIPILVACRRVSARTRSRIPPMPQDARNAGLKVAKKSQFQSSSQSEGKILNEFGMFPGDPPSPLAGPHVFSEAWN